MRKKTADIIEYNKNFRKENYDHVNLNLSKGKKEIYKKRAAELGLSLAEKDLASQEPKDETV